MSARLACATGGEAAFFVGSLFDVPPDQVLGSIGPLNKRKSLI
jgi:hypothetical protein